jgi:hypothetical protein
MGKHSGYDIYWNNAVFNSNRLIPSDWRKTKAEAKRRVDFAFDGLSRGEAPVIVLAVDPDTGVIVAGRMEV